MLEMDNGNKLFLRIKPVDSINQLESVLEETPGGVTAVALLAGLFFNVLIGTGESVREPLIDIAKVDVFDAADDCIPEYLKSAWNYRLDELIYPHDYNELLLKLLALPNIANSDMLGGHSAVVLRRNGFSNNIGLALGFNPRYSYLDPERGAAISVAGVARRLVCAGVQPLAATLCLNYGNQDTPEAKCSLGRCVEGIKEASRIMDIPVKAEFYPVPDMSTLYPNPVIGMVGVVNELNKDFTPGFKDEGDLIFLLGENKSELGGSEYLKLNFGLETGKLPALDLKLEKQVQAFVLDQIKNKLIKSAQDCSEGGLGVALALSCITGEIGADITMVRKFRGDALLFGETQSRIIVTVDKNHGVALVKKLVEDNLPFSQLGRVGGKALAINVVNPGCTGCGGSLVNLPVTKMEETWRGAMECLQR